MFASNPHYSVKLKSMFELALSHHHQYQQSGMQYPQQFQTGESPPGVYGGDKTVGGVEQSVHCPRSPQTEGEEEDTGKHEPLRGQGISKPSFSIESLLGRKGEEGKGARFAPYSVPQTNRSGAGGGAGSSKGGGGSQVEEKVQGKSGENKGASTGGNRRAAKSKRVRTIFTPEQLERLEAEFERQQYMVGPERLYLASSLYLTEAQVKVWFQNRRIKWRKQHLEMEQQRLAIYRTLAEQDMLSGSTSPRPPGPGGDDESSTGSSPTTEVDTSGEDSREDFDSSQNPVPLSAPSSKVPPSSSPSPRHRVPLQQSFNLNNEDYMEAAPQPPFLFPRSSSSK